MHFVVFGLCISSSWGNGHATLWRGLVKALVCRGHTLSFYEKDVPYYASTRDGWIPPEGVRVCLYVGFDDVVEDIKRELEHTDVALSTSYCADGIAASRVLLDSVVPIKAFYDLDTPVTLDSLRSGMSVPYLPAEGLSGFDLVLSYTGGRALTELQSKLGARVVAPLYGWVDTETHAPAASLNEFRSELCYLGTFAADRQRGLDELFVKAARQQQYKRFAIGGAQYPDDFPWTPNIFFVRHLPPSLHAAFFCSARATLNVTRHAMAQYGFCPSGRLFEAAACGTPILTDWWEGLDWFFEPGKEILPVRCTDDVLAALSLSDGELRDFAAAARTKSLEAHTAAQRVLELEAICEAVHKNPSQTMLVA
jgi:spore maturation protein CgeB